MTLSLAWWLHEKVDDYTDGNPLAHVVSGIPLLHVALSPYDAVTRTTNALGGFNRRVAAQAVAKTQHSYMVRHGMNISRSSAAHFAQAGVGRASKRTALKFGARLGARLVPGLGWAMLAYDVYTVTNMILDD